MQKDEKHGKCPNCTRIMGLTKHHLVPKVKGGKEGPIMWICRDCHSQLHVLYDNNFLRDFRSTKIEVLADPAMRKFGKFAAKQSGGIKKRAPKMMSKLENRIIEHYDPKRDVFELIAGLANELANADFKVEIIPGTLRGSMPYIIIDNFLIQFKDDEFVCNSNKRFKLSDPNVFEDIIAYVKNNQTNIHP